MAIPEYIVDGNHATFIRKRANKVLDALQDIGLDEQKIVLELALCDTRGRIALTEKKSVNECVKNYYWPETKRDG